MTLSDEPVFPAKTLMFTNAWPVAVYATLLNCYPKNIITVGIDPLVNKYKRNYNKINYKISNFFKKNYIQKLKLKKKFKIITALSVFYDLRDPNKFINEVKEILDVNGIFIEVHDNPNESLCDAPTQWPLEKLEWLLNFLQIQKCLL